MLNLYFEVIDPTSVNKQGGDIGMQYRTGIYYINVMDLPLINQAIHKLQKKYEKPIVIEVDLLRNYFPAEEYHQNYLDKNPHGYCHISPDFFKKAAKAHPTGGEVICGNKSKDILLKNMFILNINRRSSLYGKMLTSDTNIVWEKNNYRS